MGPGQGLAMGLEDGGRRWAPWGCVGSSEARPGGEAARSLRPAGTQGTCESSRSWPCPLLQGREGGRPVVARSWAGPAPRRTWVLGEPLRRPAPHRLTWLLCIVGATWLCEILGALALGGPAPWLPVGTGSRAGPLLHFGNFPLWDALGTGFCLSHRVV